MIEAFHKAFKAQFNAATTSAFYMGLGGRMHLHTAPENETEPYAVFFLVSATAASTFTERRRDMLLQVNIFAPDRGQAMQLADACLDLFHDAEIQPVDTICTYRLQEGSVFGPEWRDASWQMSIELGCLIESQ